MASRRIHTRFVSYLLPLFVLVGVWSLLYAYRALPRQLDGGVQAQVLAGKDYYLTVALVEFRERDAEGQPWDSISESGPDIFVEIFWKGNRIYRSTIKEDTFIAKWSNAELNLRAVALKGEATSVDDVTKAARVNVRLNESVEIKVYDSDLMGSTLAGSKTLQLSELQLGDTVYADISPSVRRIVVRVTDMSQG